MVNFLLTGGSGFLGKFLISELLSPGSPLQLKTLRVFDTVPYNGPADPRIEFIPGNVLDREALNKAC